MVKRKIYPESGSGEHVKKNTGGATGSHSIKLDDATYQEKPSLRDKSYLNARNLKAAHTDRENLGEVIAACYAQAYLGKAHAPQVEAYYDAEKKRVEVLSKYLENTSCTMDQYYQKHINPSFGKRKHVFTVLTTEESASAPAGEWHIHPDTPIARTLARTHATAAIFGDHDLNPGNRMVIEQENSPLEIAIIDFGHAFNDLIHAPSMIGGSIQTPVNPIFDFFNRTSVAGARPGGDISKFWRDYHGFLPSKLLGEALIEVGENQVAQQEGLDAAKQEFTTLFELIEQSEEDDESKAYVLKSFNQIHHAITGQFFPQDSTDKQKVKIFFEAIDSFIKKNAENAVQAGHMMILQAELDEKLTHEISDLEALTEQYRRKFKHLQLMDDQGVMQCPWFKTSHQDKAFKGSLENYIAYRNQQYLQKTRPLIKNTTQLEHFLLQIKKLIDYIKAYFSPAPENKENTGIELSEITPKATMNETQTFNAILTRAEEDLSEINGQVARLNPKDNLPTQR
ncbi:MAG: hypothetical protein P1U61_02345 [Legionellaceae bacterium]|nr:hypothetical protein [Legionellaceae bacterium]